MTHQIMLVEDDDLLRELLEMTLMVEGFDVVLAADGVQGLQALENSSPDLIILDLMMPNMDGLRFMEELKAVPEAPSVLVLSASATAQTAEKALRVGASGMIRKPVDTDELLAEVRRLLSDRKA